MNSYFNIPEVPYENSGMLNVDLTGFRLYPRPLQPSGLINLSRQLVINKKILDKNRNIIKNSRKRNINYVDR